MTGTLALMIPLLALSIPIIAIIAGTYAKTHSGTNPDLKNKITQLEEKILELQTSNLSLESTVNQLEEKQSFLSRLIEDKS
jgi:predicted PurR-regulated permease PerM